MPKPDGQGAGGTHEETGPASYQRQAERSDRHELRAEHHRPDHQDRGVQHDRDRGQHGGQGHEGHVGPVELALLVRLLRRRPPTPPRPRCCQVHGPGPRGRRTTTRCAPGRGARCRPAALPVAQLATTASQASLAMSASTTSPAGRTDPPRNSRMLLTPIRLEHRQHVIGQLARKGHAYPQHRPVWRRSGVISVGREAAAAPHCLTCGNAMPRSAPPVVPAACAGMDGRQSRQLCRSEQHRCGGTVEPRTIHGDNDTRR